MWKLVQVVRGSTVGVFTPLPFGLRQAFAPVNVQVQ